MNKEDAQRVLNALTNITKHFGISRLHESTLADTTVRGDAQKAMKIMQAEVDALPTGMVETTYHLRQYGSVSESEMQQYIETGRIGTPSEYTLPAPLSRDDTEHGKDYFTAAHVQAAHEAGMRAAPGGGCIAEERNRILDTLKRFDWHTASIFRHYYPSATGDYVDLRELRKILEAPEPLQ